MNEISGMFASLILIFVSIMWAVESPLESNEVLFATEYSTPSILVSFILIFACLIMIFNMVVQDE